MVKKWKPEMFLYLGIFFLALFLRIYKLGELPFGLNVDEAGMGYDAFALANWGMDRYYKRFPVYFINYGSGQSVLYGYCCALLMKFFEPTTVLLRTPAVVFGMMAWLFGTLMMRRLCGRKPALAGAFLLAVCPCFVLHSRMGLDCFLFSGTSTASLYALLCAVQAEGKRADWLYALVGAGLGISLYTYALSWLAVPAFLVFLLAYLIWLKKIKWRQILFLGIPLAVFAAPLLMLVAINAFGVPEIATRFFSIPKLMVYRGAELSLKNVINNIPRLIQCYFFYDDLAYNSLQTFFSLYLISIPFCFAGIWGACVAMVRSVREKTYDPSVVLLAWLLGQTCMGLLIKEPNANKLNAVYFALLFFTIQGLVKSWSCLKKERSRKIFTGCVSAAYFLFAVCFAFYYFTDYKEDTFPLPLFWATYAEVLDEYEDVIGGRMIYTDCPYAYYALGERLAPTELKLVELGVTKREGISFQVPEEQDENGFYVLFRRPGLTERLEEAGFTRRQSGWFSVLYKE